MLLLNFCPLSYEKNDRIAHNRGPICFYERRKLFKKILSIAKKWKVVVFPHPTLFHPLHVVYLDCQKCKLFHSLAKPDNRRITCMLHGQQQLEVEDMEESWWWLDLLQRFQMIEAKKKMNQRGRWKEEMVEWIRDNFHYPLFTHKLIRLVFCVVIKIAHILALSTIFLTLLNAHFACVKLARFGDKDPPAASLWFLCILLLLLPSSLLRLERLFVYYWASTS